MSKSKIGTIEAISLVLSVLAPFTVISLSRTFINWNKIKCTFKHHICNFNLLNYRIFNLYFI